MKRSTDSAVLRFAKSLAGQLDSIGRPAPSPIVRSFGAKAGLSYAERRGWSVGVYDVYPGRVTGYISTPNPKSAAHHLLSAQVRVELEKYLGPAANGFAVFAHCNNLANHAICQPMTGGDMLYTLPVQLGRTIVYGLEFTFKPE